MSKFLSQSFLIERIKEERELEDDDIIHSYGYQHEEDREKQLEYGQVYVQLLKDEYSEPLFSLQSDMEVADVVSQLESMMMLYLAGDFVDDEEASVLAPLQAKRSRQAYQVY